MAGIGGGKPGGYVKSKEKDMPNYGDPHYTTFVELFAAHIAWSYESQYPPRIRKEKDGLEYINFHKLTLCSSGIGSYKMEQFTFEPHIWYKVKKQAELLTPDPIEEVLYGDSDTNADS